MTRSFFKDQVTFEDMWPPRTSELSPTVGFVCVEWDFFKDWMFRNK